MQQTRCSVLFQRVLGTFVGRGRACSRAFLRSAARAPGMQQHLLHAQTTAVGQNQRFSSTMTAISPPFMGHMRVRPFTELE